MPDPPDRSERTSDRPTPASPLEQVATRRTVLLVAGALLVSSARGVAAQATARIPVVGVLNSGPPNPRSLEGTRDSLRELGYVEGQTIVLDVRSASGTPERLPGLVRDLIAREVDIIFAIGPAALRAAGEATRTLPIVAYDLETDPVRSGFVRSIARPGGNVTGLFLDVPSLTGKWLELIKEAAPRIHKVDILWDSTTGDAQLAAAKEAARGLGLDVRVFEVRTSTDLETLLRSGAKGPAGGLLQMSSPLFELYTRQIAEFALKHKVPSIAISSRFTEAGGLMSYGPIRPEFGRRVAVLIDKILKGAKPGDLPIEQPLKFELVINVKAARVLGLAISARLLSRADRVIQ